MLRVSWRPFEVAEKIGVSLAFIRKEIRLKNIKITKLGRAIVILEEDLQIYLKSRGNENK
jgi:excisionase family DNA binding protein